MVEDSLVTYFKDNLAKGYSEEQIRTFLGQQGYDAARIQAAASATRTSSVKTSPATPAQDTAPAETKKVESSSPKPIFEKQGNFFSRSFMLLKASWTVITKNKSMLLFPLLAGIFSLAFITALLFPSLIASIVQGIEPNLAMNYLLTFIVYLGLALISTFFNVCVVYVAKQELQGKEKTGFWKALGFAFSKFHLIIAWSLVSATVGLFMHFLERLAQKLPVVGFIIIMIIQKILGLLWSILSLFAIPAMVIEDIGPFSALKHAGSSLKKTWGEGFFMYFGLGGAYLLFMFIGALVFVPLIILSVNNVTSLFITLAIGFIYVLSGVLFFSVVNKVFFTALYLYSSTGAIPDGFPPSMMQSAFKPKKKK